MTPAKWRWLKASLSVSVVLSVAALEIRRVAARVASRVARSQRWNGGTVERVRAPGVIDRLGRDGSHLGFFDVWDCLGGVWVAIPPVNKVLGSLWIHSFYSIDSEGHSFNFGYQVLEATRLSSVCMSFDGVFKLVCQIQPKVSKK